MKRHRGWTRNLGEQLTPRCMSANKKGQNCTWDQSGKESGSSVEAVTERFTFPLRDLQVTAAVLLPDSWRAQPWHPGVEGGRGASGANSSVTGTSHLPPSEIFAVAKICHKWLSWPLLFHTCALCWYGSHKYFVFLSRKLLFFFCKLSLDDSNQTASPSVNLISKKSESFQHKL